MSWQTKLEAFCTRYNIPIEYIAEPLNEPKVIPMVRGKAFEFNVLLALQDILPQSQFEVSKTPMNAQLGSHDVDVAVMHRPTGQMIAVECKLAGKGTFRQVKDGSAELRVKCMRSRTLGNDMAERLAPLWGVSVDLLKAHKDQYLPQDFDVVITSIGNAFYVTDENGLFEWGPTDEGATFLRSIKPDDDTRDLKDFAFSKMYVVAASELAVYSENKTRCRRKAYPQPDSCGFIPNYSYIRFEAGAIQPLAPWVPLSGAVNLFERIAISKGPR